MGKIAAFFDIDGTLVSFNTHIISPSTERCESLYCDRASPIVDKQFGRFGD